ncbi:MAG TPA: hypothetical protein VM513_01715 [Kofleriaceae bacterium]|nr:hypothetical protein [Kofleriaceae bacterium]
MRVLAGLLLGAACAIVVACGGAKKAAMAPATMPAAASPSGMQSPEREELERLDREIEQQLGQLGLATSEPPACAMGGCPGPTAEQMSTGLTPPSSDPTCKPAPSELCQSSCKFSDSICTNAKRICEIADDLGNDAYANEKCARGTESCTKSRAKCCGCV